MSFASDTKNELAHLEPEKKCCMLAEIAGFIRVAGSIGLAGFGKFKIRIINTYIIINRTRYAFTGYIYIICFNSHSD